MDDGGPTSLYLNIDYDQGDGSLASKKEAAEPSPSCSSLVS
jgi:hypothetical protein